ncbi:MAG: saccharopine dehydrogenase NADP-binding domain-containing protein [Acidobacteria bacterium]|jgi:saccharopine dehydrogenase-like NADP-dependent oxidoreductase|nr:saccharopine dehydrogenase NADP-binding domain-containing protein [Acidobacteriota bacterium]MBA3784784.1 saccharopine dehydrogenase NADP-binding domain-containing protein [Acidobacteriota bacterium]MBA4124299.1 saccharopine dehydrogenase NADP-binding domain-containing protein [Acidobacteriota bacterium]
MTKKIFIAGSGGIGEAAALLVREWSETDPEIILGDVSEDNLRKAKDFVTQGSEKTSKVETVVMAHEGINDGMKAAFDGCDVLLDCSPGSQSPRMARFASDFKMHYANLTEYVAETDEITAFAKDAETGFVLQTGLAPGFINVLAMSLYQKFVEQFENETIEKLGMKVGALTAHAHQPHFYGFTWSPIGVATEYIKPSRVVRDYEIRQIPALSDRETIIIGGRTYEADLTSGGAADLPDYFRHKAKSLDYKTLRHVGHYAWVENVIEKIAAAENILNKYEHEELPAKLLAEFLREVPAVEDDFVLVHASVDGFDLRGTRQIIEKAFFVEPLEINGKSLRAIQTTTAVPLIESAMMLLSGDYKGVILQSQINPQKFLQGNFVSKIYKTI